MKKNILVTGACGQIGTELTLALRERYGNNNVIASDIADPNNKILESGPFRYIDCTDIEAVREVTREFHVEAVYHLVTLLSAASEENPQKAWKVNMNSLFNVLEVAREQKCAVYSASSAAVFGPLTPQDLAPQDTLQRPTNIYGVTKVAGELLCDYYYLRFGIDTRGARYSGVISHVKIPEGGITDYAVEMCYEAIKNKRYTCFLREDSRLPFMFIKDALKATIEIMEADPSRLKHRNAFNVTATSFAPGDVAEEIQKHIPDFIASYEVDPVRQGIADSIPDRIDDSAAREEWDWEPEYDLSSMIKEMLAEISEKLNIQI